MKKLLIRFGILLVIVYCISQVALWTMPFSWGNQRLNTKYEAYQKEPEKYNTLFIGASTTYRQLDPKEFDSIINNKNPGLHIHSFNFGIPANRTPQSVFMLRTLLNQDKADIHYVVIDLSELTKMGADNLHKREMIYWYNWNNIGDVMKASYESESGVGNKLGTPALHAFSFFEKSFMIGMGTTLIQQQSGLNTEPLSLGPDKDGFYALDQEMKDDPAGDLSIRYTELRTPDTVAFRTEQCQKLYDKYKDATHNPNKTMAEELNDLVKLCNKDHIHIVFMLSQRLGDRYKYLIPLYNKLPDNYKISYADPAEYPVLNDRDNLFDLLHLNSTGAYIFTEIFANDWLEKIEAQNQEWNNTLVNNKRQSDGGSL